MSKVRRKPAPGVHKAAIRKDASARPLNENKQVLLICLALLVVTLASEAAAEYRNAVEVDSAFEPAAEALQRLQSNK